MSDKANTAFSLIAMDLDVNTLFMVTMHVEICLGTELQQRALAWWGGAHLMRAVSIMLLGLNGSVPDSLAIDLANAVLFASFALTWCGARVFDRRKPEPALALVGVAIWLLACRLQTFATMVELRVLVSTGIVTAYTWLAAYEFWHGRDEALISRWPAIFMLFAPSSSWPWPGADRAVAPRGRGSAADLCAAVRPDHQRSVRSRRRRPDVADLRRDRQGAYRHAGDGGRWGGDEFVAVLTNTAREIAATVAERIQVALEKAAADIDGRLVGATVSTGMAFSSYGSFDLPAMLLQADQALYRAKAEGRNRLAVAMPESAPASDDEPPSGSNVVRIGRRSAAA
jgi:Diguanylate cyclase, GGDEF domain